MGRGLVGQSFNNLHYTMGTMDLLVNLGISSHMVMDGYENVAYSVVMNNMHLLQDRKSTRLNSSHVSISYAVFCLKKKTKNTVVATFHARACTHPPTPQTKRK